MAQARGNGSTAWASHVAAGATGEGVGSRAVIVDMEDKAAPVVEPAVGSCPVSVWGVLQGSAVEILY